MLTRSVKVLKHCFRFVLGSKKMQSSYAVLVPWLKLGYMSTTEKHICNRWNGDALILQDLMPKNLWGKVLVADFWDWQIMSDFLEKTRTITRNDYSTLLITVQERNVERSPWKLGKDVLFLQDTSRILPCTIQFNTTIRALGSNYPSNPLIQQIGLYPTIMFFSNWRNFLRS